MKALSIRQPWAWLILHAGKDIENRTWYTPVRGRVLIHAAKGMTQDEYVDGRAWVLSLVHHCGLKTVPLPKAAELERGGIVGSVEIFDCLTYSDSPWFNGPCGFLLRDPRVLPFRPYRGQLGFFDVPDE